MNRKHLTTFALVFALISTCAYGVISATPATFRAVAATAQPTDQVLCAPGNYDLTGYTLPNAHYVGLQGATIVSGKGAGGDCTLVAGELTGFSYSAGQLVLAGSGAKSVHGNVFGGTSDIYVAGGGANWSFTHNTLNGTTNYPISGYPGNNWHCDYNTFDLRAVNGGTDGAEGYHFIAACDNESINYNVFLGNAMRWGYGETQLGMTNLQIQHNWGHFKSGNAISCAAGGDATAPYGHQGENIDIGWNTAIIDSNPTPSTSNEVMGDKNVNIHDNYYSGFGTGILNGTGGQNGGGLVTSNNVLVFTGAAYADGDNTPWAVPARKSTGDQLFKVGAAGIPAAPAMPTNTGAASDGTTAATPIVTTIAAPANLAATAQLDGIHASWTAVTGATSYTAKWITPVGETKSQTVTGTSLIDQTVPNLYVVTYSVTATTPAGISAAASVQVQALPAQVFTPTPVVVPPVVPKTVLVGHSLDNGAHWITDATVTP